MGECYFCMGTHRSSEPCGKSDDRSFGKPPAEERFIDQLLRSRTELMDKKSYLEKQIQSMNDQILEFKIVANSEDKE